MWLQYIYLLTACINSRSKEMYEVKRRPKGLGGGGGRVLPYSLGGGLLLGLQKSYPLLD